jgi:GNAT superfamily N-acetyltransferase
LLREIAQLRVVTWAAVGAAIPGAKAAGGAEPLDQRAEHFVCFEENVLVAAVRLSIHHAFGSAPIPSELRGEVPEPFVFLSRLVVHPERQRRGLGRELVASVTDEAESLGLPSVVAFSVVPAIGKMLRARGFTPAVVADIPWGAQRKPAELLVKPKTHAVVAP